MVELVEDALERVFQSLTGRLKTVLNVEPRELLERFNPSQVG